MTVVGKYGGCSPLHHAMVEKVKDTENRTEIQEEKEDNSK
jgi:hypothetical protein